MSRRPTSGTLAEVLAPVRRNLGAARCSAPCGKLQLLTITEALAAQDELGGAAQANVYWCERSRSLHVGHRHIARRYQAWPFAIQAVVDFQRSWSNPVKLRVAWDKDAWVVTIARTPTGAVTDVLARCRP